MLTSTHVAHDAAEFNVRCETRHKDGRVVEEAEAVEEKGET